MAFRWRADDGPKLKASLVAFFIFQGIRGPVLLRNPIALVIFQGSWVQTPCPPSGSGHMLQILDWSLRLLSLSLMCRFKFIFVPSNEAFIYLSH